MSVILFKAVRDFSRIPASHAKVRFSKAELSAFNAHGWFCHYCGSAHALTTDHVLPRSMGGTDEMENIVPACATCNSSRRHRPYEDFVEIIQADMAAYQAMVMCGDCI